MTINDKIKKIKIGMASCGIAAGAEDVLALLKEHTGDILIDEGAELIFEFDDSTDPKF